MTYCSKGYTPYNAIIKGPSPTYGLGSQSQGTLDPQTQPHEA